MNCLLHCCNYYSGDMLQVVERLRIRQYCGSFGCERARCGGIVNNSTPVRASDAPTLNISHRTPHALYVFGGGVNMTSVVRLAHLYLWADRNTTKCGDNVLPACLCVSGDPRALLPTRTHLARAGRHAIPQQAEHMIALCSPINSWLQQWPSLPGLITEDRKLPYRVQIYTALWVLRLWFNNITVYWQYFFHNLS